MLMKFVFVVLLAFLVFAAALMALGTAGMLLTGSYPWAAIYAVQGAMAVFGAREVWADRRYIFN